LLTETTQPNETSRSYDPTYFEPLFKIEDQHFWFRTRNRIIQTLLQKEFANLPADYKVLEIGCGTGNVLRMLERVCRPGSVVGMDLFDEGLSFARQRVNCPLVQGDLHQPPFGINFDIIGMFDVLEHMENDHEVLEALRNLLSENGRLMLTVPAFPSLWSYFDVASCHFRRYRMEDLQTKLQQHGYVVEYQSYYMSTIFPLVWSGRRISSMLKAKKFQASTEPPADVHDLALNELRVIPGVNGVMQAALAWETLPVKRGWKLPFGTSLVAIARKV
jgi:SAM-dependent methyltransferase